MQPESGGIVSRPKLIWVGIVASGLTSLLSLVGMGAIAWNKIQSGRGWETYRTAWLFDFNWVGLLVLFLGLGVALFVGLLFRLREWLEIKALKERYGENSMANPSSPTVSTHLKR